MKKFKGYSIVATQFLFKVDITNYHHPLAMALYDFMKFHNGVE